MSEFINRACIREQCEPRERRLDYSSIMSNHVKQVSSPPRYIESPSPNNRTLMLSRLDCYLGFVFMTKVLIYDRNRGIIVTKKFMESLNYVDVIIHFRIDSFGRECSIWTNFLLIRGKLNLYFNWISEKLSFTQIFHNSSLRPCFKIFMLAIRLKDP